MAVLVGCSQPGIEKILDAAAQIDKQLYTSIGGFHFVQTPRDEIERVAGMLHDTLKLSASRLAHCTSEPGFAAFMRKCVDRFDQGWYWCYLAVATTATRISRAPGPAARERLDDEVLKPRNG